jgi:hypothetical protein
MRRAELIIVPLQFLPFVLWNRCVCSTSSRRELQARVSIEAAADEDSGENRLQ